MASAHQNTFSLPPPPQARDEFKLPSLKDLNFSYRSPLPGGPGSVQEPPVPSANTPASSEYPLPNYQPPRGGWSRSSSTSVSTPSSVHQTLHSPQQPQRPQFLPQQQQQHQQSLQRHVSYSYGQDSSHPPPPPPQMPPPQSSHHLGAGQSPRDEPHHSHKRPRSGSTSISTPSTHSPHNVYPTTHQTYPPPPPSQHALPVPPSYNQSSHVHPPPGPIPRDPSHHAPPPSSYQPHAGYTPYQSNYPAQQRPPPAQPHPQPPPPQTQQMNSPAYSQSQAPTHWPPLQPPAQLPLPPGPPQQQTGYPGLAPPSYPASYPRPPSQALPTPTGAANNSHPIPIQTSKLLSPTIGSRQVLVAEITSNCKVLYEFASRYARLQASQGDIKPSKEEIAEMTERAAKVAKLLRDLKKIVNPNAPSSGDEKGATSATSDEYRAPKRPWEEISKDQPEVPHTLTVTNPGHQRTTSLSEKPDVQQTTAEKDMEIIRNKRASSTGGSIVGHQKNKYRKRSRASPPGKCHSCNIRETPEWRRGPDGARTLCNACGLHYAKLMRKRYKEDGKPVDLQTLRASTAQARGGGTGAMVDGGTPPPPTPTKSSDAGSPSTIRSQRLSISSGTGQPNSGSNNKGSQIYQMSISGPPPPSPSELPLPGYVPQENSHVPPPSSSAQNLPLPPPQPPQSQSSSVPSMSLHSPGPNLRPPSQISGHHHQYHSQSQHQPPSQASPHSHPHQSLPPPGQPGHPGSSSGSTGMMPPWLSRSGYGHGGGMGGMYRGGTDR